MAKATTKRASRPKAKAGGKPSAKVRFTKRPAAPARVASRPSRRASTYSVHPGVEMMMKWAEELPARTGRSLEQWVELVRSKAPAGLQARINWLKREHALGTNSAWWIAERVEGKGEEDLDPRLYLKAAERYVQEQYAGKKTVLRPLYDRLLALCLSQGAELKACPCKTIVPIYRKHVVAQIKPTTNTRIDLGLALGDTKGSGRLIDTGGFAKKDRITHRIEVKSEADIDAFLEKWVKVACTREG